ncbi:DUF3151 domain-containing protein [Catenuloplanes sp. NPDC051500]|uniref:DUF3151 domain-containing protein n=1 Tax=Catenuloplanes sp. NPDC051500 TaxID=3363959 RepID=UPI003794083B
MQNLMPQPPATLLPADPAADVLATADNDEGYAEAAARFPTSSAAWAALAKRAIDGGQTVAGYAYARTGYHRGLDALRRNGWKGHGPVPWSHEPNRGFLGCLHELARAADAIGESDEAARCAQFLRDCDPVAADALAGA